LLGDFDKCPVGRETATSSDRVEIIETRTILAGIKKDPELIDMKNQLQQLLGDLIVTLPTATEDG